MWLHVAVQSRARSGWFALERWAAFAFPGDAWGDGAAKKENKKADRKRAKSGCDRGGTMSGLKVL